MENNSNTDNKSENIENTNKQSNQTSSKQETGKTLSQRLKETPYRKPRPGGFVMFLRNGSSVKDK